MSFWSKTKQTLDNIRLYDYVRLKKEMRFYIILGIIITLVLLLLTGILQIYLEYGSQDTSIIWTIISALIYGGYTSSLGIFNKGIQKDNLRYALMLIIIILFLSGFGFWSITFRFNVWFLVHKTVSVSSIQGIYFFILNIYLFTIIYFISFTTERELK